MKTRPNLKMTCYNKRQNSRVHASKAMTGTVWVPGPQVEVARCNTIGCVQYMAHGAYVPNI